jgi:hypothetical protein
VQPIILCARLSFFPSSGFLLLLAQNRQYPKSFKASLTLSAIVNQLEKLYTVQIERPFCDSFSKEWGLLATILGRCLCSATFLKPVKFDPPPSLNAIN